jgi:hypothetical protein
MTSRPSTDFSYPKVTVMSSLLRLAFPVGALLLVGGSLAAADWDAVCGVAGSPNTYYFFSGRAYWKYRGGEVEGPRSIERDWGVPGPLDAACGVTDGGRNKYYFFAGRVYWRHEGGRVTGPKSIRDDWGVTGPLDAITGVEGRRGTKYYLFKGDDYWRYEGGKLTGPNSVRREWGVIGVNAVCGVPGESNKYYLFRGERYWRYQADRLTGPMSNLEWNIR